MFKIKIVKPNMFINNQLHLDNQICQMYIYFEIKRIPNHY